MWIYVYYIGISWANVNVTIQLSPILAHSESTLTSSFSNTKVCLKALKNKVSVDSELEHW